MIQDCYDKKNEERKSINRKMKILMMLKKLEDILHTRYGVSISKHDLFYFPAEQNGRHALIINI